MLEKQTIIYDDMKQRDWGVVAWAYIKVFEYFIGRFHKSLVIWRVI